MTDMNKKADAQKTDVNKKVDIPNIDKKNKTVDPISNKKDLFAKEQSVSYFHVCISSVLILYLKPVKYCQCISLTYNPSPLRYFNFKIFTT